MEIKETMGHPQSGTQGVNNGSFNTGFHTRNNNDEETHSSTGGTITATPIMSTPPPPYTQELGTHHHMVSHPADGHSLARHLRGGHSSGVPGTVKKKRGRPRKYGQDGTVAITIKGFIPQALSPTSFPSPQKRGRGRPLGSSKKQQMGSLGLASEYMSGLVGSGFTPHAITINTGEDVAARILSFSQQGSRAICILSANGAISNVTLRQLLISGGAVTYEGRFEILSLSGSFLVTDSSGARSRTGGLSVSLVGPDGRVMGGGVAGMLIAASPVQVVVGSFMCNTTTNAQSKSSKVPIYGLASNMGKISIPELSMNDMGDKPRSPLLDQSLGNDDSSNPESPDGGKMIAIRSHGVHEGRPT